jgi:NADH-quinone oxidoreductase subunit J
MSLERLLFSIFAATSWIAGLGVVVIRDPVKSAMSLIACFFSLACLYLLQAAELIAVLEVLVYAGAIMVLFVFVIMLVEHKDEPIVAPGLMRRIMVPVKVMAVSLVAINVIVVINQVDFTPSPALVEGFGSPRLVGKEFFSSFLFQFELTSVLLLIAVVGAVIISRRDDTVNRGPHEDALGEKR